MKLLRAFMVGVLTLVVYLGVSLLGWGLRDLTAYFALAPRLVHALLVLGFAVLVAIQGYHSLAGIRGRRGERAKRVPRQTVVTMVIVLAMYLALFFLPFNDRRDIATLSLELAFRWIGVGLAGAGYALVLWSGVALGDMYSKEVTIQADHRLVTTGLYARLRHPRYLGVLCLGLGLSLLYRSWIGLIATAVLVPILLMRIRDEERSLAAEFGPSWDAYVAQSHRLIPGIW